MPPKNNEALTVEIDESISHNSEEEMSAQNPETAVEAEKESIVDKMDNLVDGWLERAGIEIPQGLTSLPAITLMSGELYEQLFKYNVYKAVTETSTMGAQIPDTPRTQMILALGLTAMMAVTVMPVLYLGWTEIQKMREEKGKK